MKRTTKSKLRSLIERIIREEISSSSWINDAEIDKLILSKGGNNTDRNTWQDLMSKHTNRDPEDPSDKRYLIQTANRYLKKWGIEVSDVHDDIDYLIWRIK